MRRGNNSSIILMFLGVLILLGLYSVWGKKMPEKYEDSKTLRNEDIELIPQADGHIDELEVDDQFELTGVAPENPAFEIGFGMGPGLYGSGRHMSEFIGN